MSDVKKYIDESTPFPTQINDPVEVNGLKEMLANALSWLEKATVERDEARAQLAELTKADETRVRDIRRLTEERDAALQQLAELQQERDEHKEIHNAIYRQCDKALVDAGVPVDSVVLTSGEDECFTSKRIRVLAGKLAELQRLYDAVLKSRLYFSDSRMVLVAKEAELKAYKRCAQWCRNNGLKLAAWEFEKWADTARSELRGLMEVTFVREVNQ